MHNWLRVSSILSSIVAAVIAGLFYFMRVVVSASRACWLESVFVILAGVLMFFPLQLSAVWAKV